MSLIIHAPNVHQGGGKTLLVELLRSIGRSESCTLLTDTRLDLQMMQHHFRIFSFPPSLVGRLSAEIKLSLLARSGDLVLCMGNLPPLLRCAGKVVVFLQNRHLVDELPLDITHGRVRLRIAIERLWLRLRLQQDVRVVVQTPSMQVKAQKALGILPKVLPFFAYTEHIPNSRPEPVTGFLYPATADKHKNHLNLLLAWKLLHESGVCEKLHLTVEGNREVLELISQLQKIGVSIVNHGHLSPGQLSSLYSNCAALIYPSYLESFGLPLLEAKAMGLPVIASEIDYVRDVVEPTETFDPQSAVSIARAVRRFLSRDELPIQPITPANFLDEIMY